MSSTTLITRSPWQLASACRQFLRWWSSEISEAVPTRLIAWTERYRAAYVLRLDGSDFVLSREGTTGRRVRVSDVRFQSSISLPGSLGENIQPGAAVTLLLPKTWVLRRSLTLPLAAAPELHAATSFLIDRISPFRADDVLHAARFLTRDRKQKTLQAEVAIVPRDRLMPVLSQMAGLNLHVSQLRIEPAASEVAWNIRLARVRNARCRPLVDRCWKGMLAVALLLALAGPRLVADWVHGQAEILAGQTTVARSQTREAATLRAEVEARSEEHSFLAKRQAGLQAIEVVDALSRMLPDDAFLFRLDVLPGEASLVGFSSDVPRVLRSLTQSPFVSADLTAPVLSGLADGKSRFELRVRFGERSPG